MHRQSLLEAFNALDVFLSLQGSPQTVIITGGSAMVLQGIKDQTPDVDAISPSTQPILDGIWSVMEDLNLSPEWFNFDAAGYWHNDIPPEGLVELWRGKSLQVMGPNPKWLFFKKAESGRFQKDQDDVVLIVKSLGWDTGKAESEYRAVTGKAIPQNIYHHLQHYVG